jgi:hypothetical protein
VINELKVQSEDEVLSILLKMDAESSNPKIKYRVINYVAVVIVINIQEKSRSIQPPWKLID